MANGTRIARRDFNIMIDGELCFFYAGDEIEAEVVGLVDNVSIWDGEEKFSPGNTDAGAAVVKSSKFGGRDGQTGFGTMNVKELIQYAKDHDVELPAHAKKSALIEALEDAGLEAP